MLHTGLLWTHSDAEVDRLLEVNVLGVVNGMRAALEVMRPRGVGGIVNIASLAALTAVPGEALYSATKHAVLALSLGTAADLRRAGERGITGSAVRPDGMWTPMLHGRIDHPEAAMSFSEALLTPAQVADVVLGVVRRPRPVTSIPRWRGAQARLFDLVPRMALALSPSVLRVARAQQKLRQRRMGR